MKNLKLQVFSKKITQLCVLILSLSSIAIAQYVETMDTTGLIKNLKLDYGLVNDSAKNNQSSLIQNAINDVSDLGGGRLVMPKGIYKFTSVYMKSNVHLMVEAGTLIKPDWPAGEKVSVFIFDVEWDQWKADPTAYIENVSIRGIGGHFTVDYHDRIRIDGEGVRAVTFRMVRNFLVSDMDVKDNYTTYCGLTLAPSKSEDLDVSTWDVSRPTEGSIKNCRIFKASPGYGLVQLHGAQSVYFENLYALGGVTLRLETGANTKHIGVFDISGKNIVNQNGRAAVMLGPHSAKNGVVVVDSIKSIGSAYAVTIGMGGVKDSAPDQTPGYFSAGSKVSNIHAIFGMEAQVKNQSILMMPVEYYADLKLWPDNKFLDAPSIGAVRDNSDTYDVIIENVSMEGFTYNANYPILTDSNERAGKWGNEFSQWKIDYPNAENKTSKGSVISDYEVSDYIPIEATTEQWNFSEEAKGLSLILKQEGNIVIIPSSYEGNFFLVNTRGMKLKSLIKGINSIQEMHEGLYYIVQRQNGKVKNINSIVKLN